MENSPEYYSQLISTDEENSAIGSIIRILNNTFPNDNYHHPEYLTWQQRVGDQIVEAYPILRGDGEVVMLILSSVQGIVMWGQMIYDYIMLKKLSTLQ